MYSVVSPLLGRVDLDRAADHRTDETWLAQAWSTGLVMMLTDEGEVPITEAADGPHVQWRESSSVDQTIDRVLLGIFDDRARFMVNGRRDIKADGWQDLRGVGVQLPEVEASFFVEALGISNWHRTHRHCPRCGAPTRYVEAGWSTECTADQSRHFPRTDPAVIMLVNDGADRCVLGRQAAWPEGRFSILAGFVEPGETAEQAVRREVAEEVGLTVTDVRYVGSQPWPFPASLMLGYVATVTGSEQIVRADGEIAEAAWFSKDDIRQQRGMQMLPNELSIAYHIINGWISGELDA